MEALFAEAFFAGSFFFEPFLAGFGDDFLAALVLTTFARALDDRAGFRAVLEPF